MYSPKVFVFCSKQSGWAWAGTFLIRQKPQAPCGPLCDGTRNFIRDGDQDQDRNLDRDRDRDQDRDQDQDQDRDLTGTRNGTRFDQGLVRGPMTKNKTRTCNKENNKKCIDNIFFEFEITIK